ncbi:TPA: acyltransferase, partial [Pseudomonas aeruginosa]|nr:acyltransferase [Pseudomonas aeruginosa]
MSPTSALPALACLAVALATCEFIRRLGSARLPASRFVTIDGLRGYLAFFVFLHHSSIWYYYLKDGLWQLPPSRLYAHFGQTSVALFFMVTGFLFAHKLLHSRGTPIRWLDVYASRIARLLPAYLLAMALLFLLVFTATGFSLREAPSALLGKMLDWLLFSIPSKPDMNGFIGTFRIVAGVTWTLPYEWLFYFCLPFLGVLLGNRPSPVAMAIMAGMIWLVLKAWQPNWTLAYMFVAGGLSALAVRSTHLQRFAASIPGNLLCLALLLLPGVLFPSAYQETAILILGLAFLLIAAGSSLFGLLTQALSRFLGEMTYSMYLLHGCILFISFELLIGRDNAKA